MAKETGDWRWPKLFFPPNVVAVSAGRVPAAFNGDSSMNRTIITAAVAIALFSTAANAQSNSGAMKMDHAMPGMTNGDMKGMNDHGKMAMSEYMSAMKKMDAAMMAAKGSSADSAFARKMIAHHDGAIAMAQIELKHGMDADAKRIAQQTIDENTKGKADLENWLKSHGS